MSKETDISPVQGLILLRNLINIDEQRNLLNAIDKIPWSNALSRRTQHYGGRYDYKTRRVENNGGVISMKFCPFPIDESVKEQFQKVGLSKPDQCIVNEYLSGQCISAHIDSSVFGLVIGTISLGDFTMMIFRRDGHLSRHIELQPGDVLFLTGDARDKWTHETVPVRKSGYRRVSITYRTLYKLI